MEKYNLYNKIFGWITFGIAAFVYVSTIEPTASWWDCGEYISASYKLMVGHEPGAPMFQMIARLFSLMAMGDVTQVAKWVNIMSGLASAFTILFLFWSITFFAKKIIIKDDNPTMGQILAIIGSGMVGGLAYTFSDSFWFSAVEGEVYAMSSFFTAIVVWCILKWESVADKPHADRWILLIALLMGMSIGVHLLNLLAIPALVFVYYFKKYPFSIQGFILTGVVSIVVLLGVQYGIIPGVVKLASVFELIFVNDLGMPFNTGVIIYAIILIGAVVYGLYYTQKNDKPILNTVLLSFTMLMIGYSAYAQTVIRSNANTPMDESNPDNVFALYSYLNREQYGDRPLFYGQYFNAQVTNIEEGAPIYHPDEKEGKYIIVDHKSTPEYEEKNSGYLPRMYSPQAHHIREYKNWTGTNGKRKPRPSENFTYLWRYQMGHMYFRYFMWNFAGRQNDIQGNGSNVEGKSELMNGNWISGIKFLDEMRLGPQDKLPSSQTSNMAHNKFYLLPLILGLLGAFFHFRKDKSDAFIVGLLFFMTGIAIVIYLNQYPMQPRERDYAYAGSFYAYAMWIGLGVLAIFDFLQKKLGEMPSAGIATVLCLVAAPVVMARDGWDDHNRSNRTAARDLASNYLNSCAPNAIIFTNGDNDTFPLWYAQEVEGIRTDVRVVNLSLLNTNWYINQLRRRAYESAPLPFSLSEEKLLGNKRLQIPIYDRNIKDHLSLEQVIDFVGRDDEKAKVKTRFDSYNYIPTNKLMIPVDSAAVIANGTVSAKDADKIVPAIKWELKETTITRNMLMVLDILAHNNWERPVYFAITVGNDYYLNLENYFRLEGLAYRVVPITKGRGDGMTGTVNTEVMYDKLVEEFKWGNMQDPSVYHGTETVRMAINFRNIYARLALNLMAEGEKEKAEKVLDRCLEVMPKESIGYNFSIVSIIDAYYKLGNTEKALELSRDLWKIYEEEVRYYSSLKKEYAMRLEQEPYIAYRTLRNIYSLAMQNKQNEYGEELMPTIKEISLELQASPAGALVKFD